MGDYESEFSLRGFFNTEGRTLLHHVLALQDPGAGDASSSSNTPVADISFQCCARWNPGMEEEVAT